MQQDIKDSIDLFSGISLKEMNSVALMKRTDTKFIINKSLLLPILEQVKSRYKILEIKGDKLMSYTSLYFDTPKKKFFHDHHNGKINRTKIRMRKYIESDLCFLEIKQKNGKGETNKSRISIDDFETELSETSSNFIKKVTTKEYELLPTLWNSFNRMTLVNVEGKERVTIDLNLSYSINGTDKEISNLVIIELKQERYDRSSEIVRTLKSFRQHPYSISKYCIGMVNLYEGIKYNIFKRKIIKINKITR